MLVKALPGENLTKTLPSSIEVEGQKVLLSWPGSPATCLQCLTVGHNRKNCPIRAKTTIAPKQGNPTPMTTATPQKNKATSYAKAVTGQNQSNTKDKDITMQTETEIVSQGPSNMYNNPMQDRQVRTPEPRDPSTAPNQSPQTQMEIIYPQEDILNNKRTYQTSPTPLSTNQSRTVSYEQALHQYVHAINKFRKTDQNPDDNQQH